VLLFGKNKNQKSFVISAHFELISAANLNSPPDYRHKKSLTSARLVLR
jgi:hypothetical protein